MVQDDGNAAHWLPPNHPLLTPERFAMGDILAVETDRGGVEVRSYSEPLHHYALKGSISEKQKDAGERLHRLWYYGWAARYRMMRFAEPAAGADLDTSLVTARRYKEAMDAIRGHTERKVAYSVCCFGEYVGNLVASSKRTAERRGIVLLRSALDDLTDHFEL